MKRPLALLLLLGLAACAGKPVADAAAAPAQAAAADTAAATDTPPPAASAAPADTAPAQAAAIPPPTATPAAPEPPQPSPPAAAAPAPDQPTPPLPAEGPLPEVTDSAIGYASPEEALAALRLKPGAKLSEQDGWTIVQDAEDARHIALWSFTPPGHPAHPAMVKRTFYEEGGRVWMTMEVRCGAGKRACDDLVRQFQALDDALTRAVRSQVRPAAPPREPAAPAPQTAPPAEAAPVPVSRRELRPPAPAPSSMPPSPPPPAQAAAPSAARDRWRRAVAQECPGRHAEWLCDACYAPLLAGFERTLPLATRRKAEQTSDIPHRIEAYHRLGLLHRFVRHTCASVQCEAPGQCGGGPR